jgi:hypothetical protein
LFGNFKDIGVFVVCLLRPGDMSGHPMEHLRRCFLDLAARIFFQITPFQNGFGVGTKIEAVSHEHIPGQAHRRLCIKTVFGQLGLDHLIHHGRSDRPKVHTVDGRSNESDDLFGLTFIDGIGADEVLAKNLIVPDMGGQVHVTVVDDEDFLFLCHRVSRLHWLMRGVVILLLGSDIGVPEGMVSILRWMPPSIRDPREEDRRQPKNVFLDLSLVCGACLNRAMPERHVGRRGTYHTGSTRWNQSMPQPCRAGV